MFEEGLTIMANLGTEGFKKGTKEIEKAVKTMSTSVNRMSKQMTNGMKRLITSIIGVGSAYGILSKGISTFLSQNEELSQRMNAIWTAVGNLLGPIITQIIEWVSTAVSYFLGFLKLLGVTGKSASELSTKASKSVKELQRTIAGFDELNVLQDNSNNGSGNDKQNPLKDIEPTEWMKRLAELLKNKMWDEAADLIIEKINGLIYKIQAKAYEAGQKIGEYLGGLIHIAARIIRDVDWKALGDTIAKFFNGLMENIDGKDLGTVLVGKFVIAIGILTGFLEGLDWGETADIIIDAIIGIFESLGDAIAEADFQKIGEGIRTFFTKIWDRKDEIAQAIFDFLHEVWEAALQLLNGILGGDSDEEHPIIVSLRKVGDAIQHFKEVASPALQELWDNFLQPFGEWLLRIGLPAVLDAIAKTLDDIADIISGKMSLSDFVQNMSALEAVIVGIAGITAFNGLASLASSLSAIASIDIGGAITAKLGALATTLGTLALAAADAVLVAYDVQAFQEAADTYEAAFDAHNTETETALTSYARLYEEKGKEVADQWAEMVYQIDTSNMSFDESQAALAEKVESYWDGVPENMWEGAKQGIEYYFGEGKEGGGILGLLSDAFTGAVNGIKDLLGIHSPSTVLEEIGKNMIQGLIDGVNALLPNLDTIKNGIAEAWEGLKTTVSGWWDSVKGWFTGADKTSESADGMETSLSNASTAATESANAINEVSGTYSQAYSAIATSAADAAQAVETNTTKIKDDTVTNLDATAEKVKTSSEEIKTTWTNALDQLNTDTQSKLSILLSNAGSIFSQLASNARIWGADMMIQFINGINEMIPALVDTLIGIANTVDSYIGFSLPEKGPLSDFDKSGPDMMDLFAEGMEGKQGRLVDALNAIAETVSFRMPAVAGGAILPYGVAAASAGSSDSESALSEVYERLLAAIKALEDAAENNQYVLQFGDIRMLVKAITKIQRQMARAEG